MDTSFANSKSNPFSASRLRPGTIPFVFGHGESLEGVVKRFEEAGGCGQIIGMHGTGKSTLLAQFLPAVAATGRATLLVTLHDRQRSLPPEFRAAMRRQQNAVIAVDGCEQLYPWNSWLLKRYCRWRGLGLLVTSHLPAGLPEIYRTDMDVPRAWRVVQRLQEGYPSQVTLADVVERIMHNRGNLREALFDLYDVYERRCRGQKQS